MKFGTQFEFHKIPEWYINYLDYVKFKELISNFKKRLACKISLPYITLCLAQQVVKLRGLYYLTAQNSVNQLNLNR